MATAGILENNLENNFVDAVDRVQEACRSNQQLFMSQVHTDAPSGLGVVSCFAVLHDELATELRNKLDNAIQEFLREHHYS